MYAPYFGLTQEPFSIAPDPRYLFMSERHREALAHLLYGIRAGGGFVLLTGEIGAGKTTVCRCFLEQIPAHCNVAYIFNPKLTVTELLQSVCDEFHVAVPPPAAGTGALTVKDYLDPLNDFLLNAHASGRNNVLIIDEAQNLSAEVLEQLRLLTNLETNERKLLQIILIGQPELRTLLARPELEQLAQRVIARYHLEPLTVRETAQYVRHRLEVAGLVRPMPFDAKALVRIHAASGGVPRRINLLCDRAMLGAFATSAPGITRFIVDQAAREVFGPDGTRPRNGRAWQMPAAVLATGLLVGAGLMLGARYLSDRSSAASAGREQAGPSAAKLPSTGAATPSGASQTARSAPVPSAAPSAASSAQPPASAPAATAAPVTAQGTAVANVATTSSAAATLLRDERLAWRELAQAWKVEIGEGEPCQLLARQQVSCFSRNMTLAMIRQLARPGIVTLDSQTSAPSYALLMALTDTTATLRAGGTEQTVTLDALAARWQGDWGTLWRAPPGYDAAVPLRESPELGRWVREHLPAADAQTPLRARLRSFQLAQGLNADGALGPLTYMQLNRRAGVDEPRLRTGP